MLRLTERKSLHVTAVTEVVQFEETQVVLQTELGTLTVLGEDLKLKELSTEGGNVAVEGSISALSYNEQRAGSFWGRMFG